MPKPLQNARPRNLPALSIGDWWIERATNEIRRLGETVRLEPKVMDVLIALAEHAGGVVSREELLIAVWPGVVVGDEALTQSIIKLRRALGDHPRSPAFVETIPKRGYRLIAAVTQGHAETPPGNGDKSKSPSAEVARGRIWAVAVIVVAISVVVAVIHFVGSGTPLSLHPSNADGARSGDEDAMALPTVTVLPFETVGSGVEQGYLAQGISSDLMTDLSRLSRLRVINTSTAGASGPGTSFARYVIAGTVQKDGAMLRINATLTDARTNVQLWSRRYERPSGDLLAIQNEISRDLIARLPATLSEAERRRLAKRYTRSAEAYDDFLRGKALFLVRRAEANEQARAFYRTALDLDPQFARAYAGLAMTYAMDYRYAESTASTGSLDRALQLAETARDIDPEMPEVYWAVGFVDAQSRRYDQAVDALNKAIELNPSYADAYALMAGIYTYIGQPARSIPLLRTALRLNRGGGYLYFLLLGRAYLFENDLDQALLNLREAVRRNPEDMEAHIYLAATLVASGDKRGAESEADEVRVCDEHFSIRNWLSTYPMTSPGQIQRLLALATEAGL